MPLIASFLHVGGEREKSLPTQALAACEHSARAAPPPPSGSLPPSDCSFLGLPESQIEKVAVGTRNGLRGESGALVYFRDAVLSQLLLNIQEILV